MIISGSERERSRNKHSEHSTWRLGHVGPHVNIRGIRVNNFSVVWANTGYLFVDSENELQNGFKDFFTDGKLISIINHTSVRMICDKQPHKSSNINSLTLL